MYKQTDGSEGGWGVEEWTERSVISPPNGKVMYPSIACIALPSVTSLHSVLRVPK